MRVTNKMATDAALNNLNLNLTKLQRIQDKLSSGKEILRPSDDPVGTSRALGYRNTIANRDQYINNIDDGMSWLGLTDTTLGSLSELQQRARELAIRAGNAVLTTNDQREIASEIDELLSETIQIGNATYGEQYLFGGYKTTTVPFTIDAARTTVTYNGDSGQITREMEPGSTVAVNLPGNSLFANIFTSMIQLRNDLNTGNIANVTTIDISNLDTAINDVLNGRSIVGARYNRMESAKIRMMEYQVNVKDLLSKVEDADFTKVVSDLTMQESVYKAALAINARTIQPSLLDFLR